MLQPGDTAPEIDAPASDGTRFSLAAQSTRLCTVLYFFPKAFTPGCTAETRRFRDNYPELTLAGATLVGVSTDDHESQCAFAESLRAPFPMVGDEGKVIATAYGVLWPLLGRSKRVTFIINPLRTIEAVFRHEVQISKHNDDVLRYVDQMYRGRRSS